MAHKKKSRKRSKTLMMLKNDSLRSTFASTILILFAFGATMAVISKIANHLADPAQMRAPASVRAK